jgi:pimeloyl-ACP methyl ester carboxylesterase
VLIRIIVLILLVAVAGAVVWSAVTHQRIDLIEETSIEELDQEPFVTAEGTSLNVTREGEGTVPLVLLHDVDVAGSVLWDGVVAELDPKFSVIRVDLPGFGLSERIPEEGSAHTVASMAVEVGDVIDQNFDQPAIVAGVGLGGEAGVVMIDVDFYRPGSLVEFFERLPWFGTAVTFAFETAGSFAADRWAPKCEEGGWCPSPSQVAGRDLASTIEETTDSFRAFRRTPAASLVPSKLNEITVPVHYFWSQQGEVPRVQEAMPEAQFDVLAEAWKAHLDFPADVAAALAAMAQ